MKKTNFLKIALTLVMAFVLTSAWAQVANSDYAEYDANLLVPTNVDYVTLLTAGTTNMGYYALPDLNYHPGYVNPGWALTADFVWDWTVAPVMTVTKPGAANYAQVAYTATGNYVVTVAEHAPAAFGGCADGSPTVMNVTVIAPPTGTISIAPTTGVGFWQQIVANQSYQICSSQPAEPITIEFNEAVPNALGSYSFQIIETIENIDGAGTVINTQQAATVIEAWSLTSKLQAANLDGNVDATTLDGAAFTAGTPSFTFEFNSDALDILQDGGVDARTRYTYTVTRAGDPASFDFVSNISHKSGYIDGIEYTPFTVNNISFIVNPAPVTGPIYHISNTFYY